MAAAEVVTISAACSDLNVRHRGVLIRIKQLIASVSRIGHFTEHRHITRDVIDHRRIVHVGDKDRDVPAFGRIAVSVFHHEADGACAFGRCIAGVLVRDVLNQRGDCFGRRILIQRDLQLPHLIRRTGSELLALVEDVVAVVADLFCAHALILNAKDILAALLESGGYPRLEQAAVEIQAVNVGDEGRVGSS